MGLVITPLSAGLALALLVSPSPAPFAAPPADAARSRASEPEPEAPEAEAAAEPEASEAEAATKTEPAAATKTEPTAKTKTKTETKTKTKPKTETATIEPEPDVGEGEGEDEDEEIDGELEAMPTRRFMLGLEGVVMQAPPLRPSVVTFDPRFIGRTVSMGGLGLFARLRVHPRIAVEATVRSGSARYAGRPTDDPDVVSHDQVMADLGVLLFVARGEMIQLAFDAGLGGMGTRVRYELDREGTQLFGSGLVRVGADVEFLVKRIAFVVSVRAVGVFADVDRVRNRGELLQGRTAPAPVPALQTLLVGTAGIAYRF